MPHSNETSPLLENARTIKAKLNYLDKSVTHPYFYASAAIVPEGVPTSNIVGDEHVSFASLTDAQKIAVEFSFFEIIAQNRSRLVYQELGVNPTASDCK